MNTIVTGGAGFIGSHLVDKLIELGHEVIVIDNLSTGSLSNINPKAIFINEDINNDLVHIFQKYKPTFIYHLAAQINLRKSFEDPTHDATVNILGSLNIIKNCIKYNSKLIFVSTGGAIYSPNAILPWTEESLARPVSPYGLAKLTVERYIGIYHNIHNLNYCIFRLSNVAGPRQNPHGEAGVLSIFVEAIKQNKKLKVFDTGKQSRDFIDVQDVCDALLFGMKEEICADIYNVSSKTDISILSIIEMLEKYLNRKLEIDFKDKVFNELENTLLDNSKLKSIGWNNKIDINDGIKTLLQYEGLIK